MTNQEIIGRLEALKSQHRTGAAVLLEAAQHFMRAVESQRDVECQDIDRLIRSLGGAPEAPVPAAARVESKQEIKPYARVLDDDERKALADLRAACVKKAAAGGQQEILLFLQNHSARTIYELDPKYYEDLLTVCNREVC